MKGLRSVLLVAAVGSLLSTCTTGATGIQIEEAWARPALIGENSAIYFRITSHDRDDSLMSANASPAINTELHHSIRDDNGTMKMEPPDRIELPKNEAVELIPGGFHVMLMGLTEDLYSGDMVSLQLVFENHDEIKIDVPVQDP